MYHNRIVLIAPRQQLVIHSGMDVFDNESVRKINAFVKVKEAEYGEVERILLAPGRVDIMQPGDPIPVPLQAGKGLMIPGGGGCIDSRI